MKCTKVKPGLPFHITLLLYIAVSFCAIIGIVAYSFLLATALAMFYFKVLKAIFQESKKLLMKRVK